MDIAFKLHLYNIGYFDDVILTSRCETQMGDQVIFISYPLKFDLVKVTIFERESKSPLTIRSLSNAGPDPETHKATKLA